MYWGKTHGLRVKRRAEKGHKKIEKRIKFTDEDYNEKQHQHDILVTTNSRITLEIQKQQHMELQRVAEE